MTAQTYRKYLVSGTPSAEDEVSISYVDALPLTANRKGTILLIHGFPETSYQFRHVIPILTKEGYRVVAPDMRGQGHSTKPVNGYDKVTIAADFHQLLTEKLGITEKIHVVGHDIGGMAAHAYVQRYPEHSLSVAWGECPLPGTKSYYDFLLDPGEFHFHFHWQLNLPEALTYGRERIYLKHFYDRLTHNPEAIDEATVDYYAKIFAQPGGMRAGFNLYRGFHQDAEDNKNWLKEHGKLKTPCMTLNGDQSFLANIAKAQAEEVYESVEEKTVKDSGHWCSEENPEDFAKKVLEWVARFN